MRRFPLLIFIVFLLVSVYSLEGQSVIGANSGLHNLKLTGDRPTAGYLGLQRGYKFGLNYDYRINQIFSINTQLSYSHAEVKYVYADTTLDEEKDSMRLELKGLTIPVSAVVWSENGRYYVLAGLEAYFPLSFNGYHPEGITDFKEDMRNVILFAHFGAGMIFSLGKPFLFFEFRYSQGLVDLNNKAIHDSEALYPRTKAFNIGIDIGIKFPLGDSDCYKPRKKQRND